MELGEKIKKLREERRLTQEELGKRINSTKQTIFKYETGIITNIPLDKLTKIATALGCSPAYLMGWDTTQQGKETPKSGNGAWLQDIYDSLSDHGKKLVVGAIEGVYRAEKGEQPNIPKEVRLELKYFI